MLKLTIEMIEKAKAEVKYTDKPKHEHVDCILIAYQWLDAQITTKNIKRNYWPPNIKRLCEHWAGRYVSKADIEVAAHLHPMIYGNYPYYNLSTKLIQPSILRLRGIGEALTQGYRDDIDYSEYARWEQSIFSCTE